MFFLGGLGFLAWGFWIGFEAAWMGVGFFVFFGLAPLVDVGWNECLLGFCEEVELAFPGEASMSGKSNPDGESSQFVVGKIVDRGKQHLFGGALLVFVVSCEIVGQIVGEGVGGEVDDGPKQDAQLCRGKHCGSIGNDALESGF